MARLHFLGCALPLAAAACFPSPKAQGGDMLGTTGIDAVGSDEAAYTTWATTEDGTTAAPDPTTGIADGSTTTATATSDGGGSSSSETGDPGALPPGYPVDQPFGDDVRELDLIGRWTLPWAPAGQPHVEWLIHDDGTFEWTERAADCSEIGLASGHLWVEGTQLAFAIDVWDKPLPWDTEAATGTSFEAPWRMRLGYTPMGGYLGLAGPSGLTAIEPWQGHAYSRQDATVGPTGTWAAESELWATPPGDGVPALIVRDRFDAEIPASPTALLVHGRTWWWPDGPTLDGDQQVNGPWSDETPGNVAGAATIGGVLHAYDALGLLSFVTEQSFKLGAPAPCP